MRRVRTSDFTVDENAPSKLILCHCEKCSLWFCLLKKNYMSQESTLFKDFKLNLVNGCFSFRLVDTRGGGTRAIRMVNDSNHNDNDKPSL